MRCITYMAVVDHGYLVHYNGQDIGCLIRNWKGERACWGVYLNVAGVKWRVEVYSLPEARHVFEQRAKILLQQKEKSDV